MRTLILAAILSAVAAPCLAADSTWLLPKPGFYCPVGQNVMTISISPDGGMGIDGLDCARVMLEGGRVRSKACHANGGSTVDYETDLLLTPSGALVHDGVLFKRYEGPRPCPRP